MISENIDAGTTKKRNLSTLSPDLVKDSTGTTSNQLYESIVNDIQLKSDGKLSKVEANIAARNLIEFVMINQLEDNKKHRKK